MHRVLHYDGILPTVMGGDGKVRMSPASPSEILEMRNYIEANRTLATQFDVIMEGETPGDDPKAISSTICPYAEVGVTWWIEAMWSTPEP